MATQQPLFFMTTDTSHATSTEYIPLNSADVAWSTIADRRTSIPTSGTFKKLNIEIDTDPGASKSYKFSLYVNGVASTTLTTTISGGGSLSVSVDADHAVSAGDLVSLECAPTGTPTTFTRLDGNIIWEPDTDDEYIILGSENAPLAPNTTEYCGLESCGNDSWGGSEGIRLQVCPLAGTIKKLHCALASTPGSGESYVLSIRVNEADPASGPSVTLDDADFDKVDNTNTASVSAGDSVSIKAVGSTSANAVDVFWSCVFVPTTSGKIPMLAGLNDSASNSATEYNSVRTMASWNATQSERDIKAVNESITIESFYVELNGSPGSGKDYDFDILVAGSVEAGLNVTIADTATSGNATGQSVEVAAGEKMVMRSVPTGTPTARRVFTGIAFTYSSASTTRSFIPAVIG